MSNWGRYKFILACIFILFKSVGLASNFKCKDIFKVAGIKTPTVEILVEGAGDVVERFYLPALKQLRDERKEIREVLVTFTDFSNPNQSEEHKEKRLRIRKQIENAGFKYLDKADSNHASAYDKEAPDYVILAAGSSLQTKLVDGWKARDQNGGLSPIRIFTEKPLGGSVAEARKLRDSLKPGDDSILAIDHYRPKLNFKEYDVNNIETFLGGLDSFESYITEDRSGSDKHAAVVKNNHRDGAIEQEGRESILAEGIAADLIPHSLAMLDYFTQSSTLKPTSVRAGKYMGVDGDPLKPAGIPNETFFAAEVSLDDNHGNPVKGKIVVGKGIRVKKYGPETERNTKILELHGKNGSRVVFDLRGSGEGASTASYLNPDGSLFKTTPLEPLPYKSLFAGIVDGKSATNEMAFPLKEGVTFREKLTQLLKGARNVPLPLYPGGMGGSHERSAPYAEDLWKDLPVMPDGEIMVTGGAGTMGKGFVHRFSSEAGLKVIVVDPGKKAPEVIQSMGKSVDIVLETNIPDAVTKLQKPRRVMVMAPNAKVSEEILNSLYTHLESGDVVIDGGNKNWVTTEQWQKKFSEKGIDLIGMGVSGGEAGAWNGSSMMAGGKPEAWKKVKEIYEAIAATVPDIKDPSKLSPSVAWVGPGGSGHFVKMTHNGIEYVEMQLLAEVYSMLKDIGNSSNGDMEKLFEKWNKTELNSFLLGATSKVINYTDEKTGKPLVEMIKPVAGQKGTGMWSSENALQFGAYAPTLPEAVFARNASGKTSQFAPYKDLEGPKFKSMSREDLNKFEEAIPKALYAARLLDFAQGMHLIDLASKEKFDDKVNMSDLTNIWRTGSILQGKMLDDIHKEFKENSKFVSPLDSPALRAKLSSYQKDLREVTNLAREHGVPVPAFSSLLNYYDTIRANHLPANLLQGMRDYFGGHTYERIDEPGIHHSEWGVPASDR